MTVAPETKTRSDDVVGVLHWLASLARTRLTGTAEEKLVQTAIAERLGKSGYAPQWVPFEAAPHIYGSLALHFGLALALVPLARFSALAVAAGHAFLAFSWWSEAVRRRFVLRKLWPHVKTQNLLLTAPAKGPLKKRIALLAHVDSAFTGFLFKPEVIRVLAAPPPKFLPFMQKQLLLPFVTLCALAGVEALSAFVAVPAWLPWVLALPSVPVFVLNLDVLLRNTVVPGAADNLSGCAAQLILAERWAARAREGNVPDGVEVVFAFTGAEEAGTLGAAHLARNMGWEKDLTEVLILDTLSNGELFILEEGEVFRVPVPETLANHVRAAAKDCNQPVPAVYPVPAGATDALVFLVEGYQAIAMTCIDPVQHAPRNYHHPLDTAENVEPEQLKVSTEIADRLLDRVARA